MTEFVRSDVVLLLGPLVCCLAAGGLLLAADRRNALRWPGVFACKVRVRSGTVAGVSGRWPRTRRYGMWVSNVLVVLRRPAVPRFTALSVRAGYGPVAAPREFSGLGGGPVMVVLRLDGGAVVEVAARGDDRDLLFDAGRRAAAGGFVAVRPPAVAVAAATGPAAGRGRIVAGDIR